MANRRGSGTRAVARGDALGVAPYSDIADGLYRGYLTTAHTAAQLLPRDAGDAALHGPFAFNCSGLIGLGLSAAALSGLRPALPRLVAGVADQLFLDDRGAMMTDYLACAEPEFVGVWPRR